MWNARADTHYLLYIYDRIRNELLEKANGSDRLLRAVYERSKQLCLRRFEKPRFDVDSILISSFNARQNQALRLLSEWRDRTAREDDESPEYILPKHMMLKIAEYLPKEKQGIFGCCNPVPVYVRQNLVQIHQLVLDARCVPVEVSRRQVADDRFVSLPEYDLDNPIEGFFDCMHSNEFERCAELNNAQNVSADEILKNVRQLQVIKNQIAIKFVANSRSLRIPSMQLSKCPITVQSPIENYMQACSSQNAATKWTLMAPPTVSNEPGPHSNPSNKAKATKIPYDIRNAEDIVPIKFTKPVTKRKIVDEFAGNKDKIDFDSIDYRTLGASEPIVKKALRE